MCTDKILEFFRNISRELQKNLSYRIYKKLEYKQRYKSDNAEKDKKNF